MAQPRRPVAARRGEAATRARNPRQKRSRTDHASPAGEKSEEISWDALCGECPPAVASVDSNPALRGNWAAGIPVTSEGAGLLTVGRGLRSARWATKRVAARRIRPPTVLQDF